MRDDAPPDAVHRPPIEPTTNVATDSARRIAARRAAPGGELRGAIVRVAMPSDIRRIRDDKLPPYLEAPGTAFLEREDVEGAR